MISIFSSIKGIATNYGHGILAAQAQLGDMKFGVLPPASAAAEEEGAAATTIQTSISPSISPNNLPTLPASRKNSFNNNGMSTSSAPTLNTASDFNQWLHAMKMVARLPGGTPPEFRRKLWLALADRHLHTNGIDWNKEQIKCLSDAWLDDDEELGIQIVKDLHRTGSSLFSGPNGNLNQAKLKRILLGFSRYNKTVGYCQGFNMLGALILQVMDKSEIEALKVMIYLIEGVLPSGYFCGSLSGLQADMAVFREILSTRLPKLSKHLQKLQGPVGEGSLEPPLINVFTMQWFLTLFCTCLPTSCVLRVWDLVLIEGSDILLRTALAIWALLAERIMTTKTADEFYCKMGTLSGELLNGHLFDSNGLIQRIVDLGPIADLQKMREKHLFNITPWKDRRGLRIFYSDDDVDSEDETWKFMSGARRASLGLSAAAVAAAASATNRNADTRDRIALDISILKKQYAKLRERQRQAHIILTNTAKQTVNSTANYNAPPTNVNQYLMGRNAIVSSKGRRIGPPAGAIPPARISQPITAATKQQQKRFRNATIDNASVSAAMKRSSDDNFNLQKSPSVTSSMSSISSVSETASTSAVAKKFFARKRSESSSYDEDSDNSQDEVDFGEIDDDDSSTDTSLCDEDVANVSSIEASPLKKVSSTPTSCAQSDESRCSSSIAVTSGHDESTRRKYSGSSTTTTAETKRSFDSENDPCETSKTSADGEDSTVDKENQLGVMSAFQSGERTEDVSPIPINDLDLLTLAFRQQITSTSQLSPIADIAKFLSSSSISPLKTPASCLLDAYPLCDVARGDDDQTAETTHESTNDLLNEFFEVNEEGVTNEYFERINGAVSERPSQLHLQGPVASVASPKVTPPQTVKCKLPDPVSVPSVCLDLPPTPLESTSVSDEDKGNQTVENRKSSSFKEKSISLDDAPIIGDNWERDSSLASDYVVTKRNGGQKGQSTEHRPISCPDTSDVCSNTDSSNKKTERILKIIEENSKILDRIMSKNAKSLATGPTATSSDAPGRTDEFESWNTVSDTVELVHEPVAINEPSGSVGTLPVPEEESICSEVTDFLNDFLKKFDENTITEGRKPPVDIPAIVVPIEEPSIVLKQIDALPTSTFDEVISESMPQTVEEIIKQAMEKSSPNRTAPILDPSIENDLESLLKISAELLREELPIISSVVEANIDDIFSELITSEMPSNTGLELNVCEVELTKGSDAEPAIEIFETTVDEQTGDISATISSIKNTIKSIDDLCQDDDRRSRERTDKTLNDIIKAVEKLEDDNRQKKHIEDEEEKITIVESTVEHVARSDGAEIQDGNDAPIINSRLLSTSRMSRDRSRITSPRHRKYDDFGEFESRVRRSKSPALLGSTNTESESHQTSHNRYSDDFTKKYSLDAFKLQRIGDGDVAAKSSSQYRSNEKLEIRHTTVTSTFYDRFLSQKLEQRHRMDRSPSSPMITKAYLDSLKPIPSMCSSYPNADSRNERRGSKSSENSPVRSHLDTNADVGEAMLPRTSFVHMPRLPYNTIDRSSTYTRSCDNIPSNLHKTCADHISPLLGPPHSGNDGSFKRHSTAGAYSNIGSLPIKPKKPSELGIKLGMYKPES